MGDGGETERRKDAVRGGEGRGHEDEQESNEVGRQVEGRKSVGGGRGVEEGGCSGREGSAVVRGTLRIPLAYLEPN